MKKITIITILFILNNVNGQVFNVNLAVKLQQALDIGLSSNVNNKGYSASVYYPGQGIWSGTAGISHAGTPITSDMGIALASNSKTWAAVAILKLVEANVLNLDAPISVWLPNYPNINPNITIRQLLNHTSGIADMYITNTQINTVWADLSRVWTPEEVLTWIGAPVHNSPGSVFSYSNTNYILLGMIVKNATGFQISQYIRDNIITPLQLNNTFYAVSETSIGVLAHPWTNKNATVTLPNVIDVSNVSQNSFLSAAGPAGSLYSSASDVVKFYNALMNGQIINNNSLAQMTTFNASISNYGLGIELFTFNGKTIWGHGGNIYFGRTRTMYDPCLNASICALSNSNPSGIDGTTALLHKVLVDYLPACPLVISGITTVCKGQNSVVYTVPLITNATTYTWNLPNGVTGTSTTNSITVDYSLSALTGSISVKGTNLYGDGPSSILAIIVNDRPATPTISVTGVSTLHSDAPSGNQWYDQNGIINGATNQDYIFSTNGNYYVIVTSSACSSDVSNTLDTSTLGVEIHENNISSIKTYPNPITNELNIEFENNQNKIDFEIINSIGQIVLKGNFINKKTININNFASGVYIIKLGNDKNVDFKKIIKE